jgi:hypothetical protein
MNTYSKKKNKKLEHFLERDRGREREPIYIYILNSRHNLKICLHAWVTSHSQTPTLVAKFDRIL